MILDDVLRNPVLKKALQAGEEGMGKVVGKLLGSDRVSSGLSSLVTSALQAKTTFDKGVQQALHVANLPSRDDVAALKRRLDELESMIDGLSARARPASGGAAPATPAAGEGPGRGDAG